MLTQLSHLRKIDAEVIGICMEKLYHEKEKHYVGFT